ncbi:gp106 [Sphingomonas phage PAU]|uniref:dUTPase n=1 Tax=Sphingomonas phage PAU TaxID=1150991 RepID=UPI000257325D|nr:dUTPase [Sphingomonas phage PAU]AFF28104.1 gp106 [Sphingomonas phage PAU]
MTDFKSIKLQDNGAVCSNLKVTQESLDISNGDILTMIFNLQKELQSEVFNFDMKEIRKTVGSMKEFYEWNAEGLRDELSEFRNAMGGLEKYPNKEFWKTWKTKHKECLEREFSDFSEQEILELKFEWIDMFKFLMNLGIMINISPQEIGKMFVAKNEENIKRMNNGY